MTDFSSCLSFLNRIGDEVYWEIWPDKVPGQPARAPRRGSLLTPPLASARVLAPQLVLSALNSSRSALAKCSFYPGYFRRFLVPVAPGAPDGPVLECRVLNKVLNLLFRRRSSSVAHEVEEVQIHHVPEEARLVFFFLCKHGTGARLWLHAPTRSLTLRSVGARAPASARQASPARTSSLTRPALPTYGSATLGSAPACGKC